MEISLSLAAWKYALLIQSIFIMFLDVVFISSGVVLFGGAGSVEGAYIATALGAFTLLVCFLGCFAALRESILLSKWYIGNATVCLVMKAIFMITFIVTKGTLYDRTHQRLTNAWAAEQDFPGAMAPVHKQYECCGWDSPNDYIKDEDDPIPATCCVLSDCSDDADFYSRGCYPVVNEFFLSQSEQLIFTCLALITLEVLSTINAYYMSKRIIAEKQAAVE